MRKLGLDNMISTLENETDYRYFGSEGPAIRTKRMDQHRNNLLYQLEDLQLLLEENKDEFLIGEYARHHRNMRFRIKNKKR